MKNKTFLCLLVPLLLLAFVCPLVGCARQPQTDTVKADEVEICDSTLRYSAAPAQDPYANVECFRDTGHIYYIIPIGNISHVPLEKSNAVYYQGFDYKRTLKRIESSAKTVEETMEVAVSRCVSTTTSCNVSESAKVGAEIDGVGAEVQYKVDVGLSTTWGETASRSRSISNAVTTAEQNEMEISFEFSEKMPHGFYRWVMMGDLNVYAAVIYNVSMDAEDDGAYSYTTFTVISGDPYFSLDYSETSQFDRTDDSKLSFTFDKALLQGVEPTKVIADDVQAGDGTKDNPLLIYSAYQFARLESDKYYRLIADIDFEGQTVKPQSDFSGTLDGGGYGIYGFNITSESDGKAGLFCRNQGKVKNLVIGKKGETTSVSVSQDDGFIYAGALCGVNNGTVENCKIENVTVSAKVFRTHNGQIQSHAGAIAGENGTTGEIIGCTVSDCSITARSNDNEKDHQDSKAFAGGVAGYSYGKMSVLLVTGNKVKSYAAVQVNGWDQPSAYSYAGGLVGYAQEKSIYRQCIGAANTAHAEGDLSKGLFGGNDGKLERCGGVLFGKRESGSVCNDVYAVGDGGLVGSGETAALHTVSDVKDISFYSDRFGYCG